MKYLIEFLISSPDISLTTLYKSIFVMIISESGLNLKFSLLLFPALNTLLLTLHSLHLKSANISSNVCSFNSVI